MSLPMPLTEKELDAYIDAYFGQRGMDGKLENCIDPEDTLTRVFATAKFGMRKEEDSET